MFYCLSQTCSTTCFRRKIGLKARRGGILVHSAFVSSLARKIMPGNIPSLPRTNFIEKRTKTTFSGNGVESGPRTSQERFGWFEKWTKIGVSSAEKFHRNVANTRNFHTSSRHSSHMHSGKSSEKIGEWRENKIFTVPNILCFGRILASPVLGYFVLSEQYLTALVLFVVAGFTDMLDGFIARRFPSQMSYLGSVLDPIADKILVGVLTVSLSIAYLIPGTVHAMLI